jgi:hypothetical protein
MWNRLKLSAFFIFLLFGNLNAQNLTGVKICINPGHGGYDSDDRNVVIAPFASGNQNGFWESKSNLDKGLQLKSMLDAAGATTIITRTTNTTADDLPLSQIVAIANQSNADFMLSIHSNAGNGIANYVLMIHYGADLTDTNIYPNFNPNNPAQKLLSDKSRAISTEIAKNLYANQLNTWSSGYSVTGDKTFARIAMGWSDGYGVLRGLTVPGVISEGSMHDYIPETYRLMNMDYKWLEAWNFYKSFCTYYNGGPIPTGNIAGMIRDSRIKLETTYYKLKGQDEMLPLNGAKVTLIETGEEYTVDILQNGLYVFKNLNPGIYHVKAQKEGFYDQTVEVSVTADKISYASFKLNRVRNTPPQVVSYTPQVAITDSVIASTTITLTFNWDMDTESVENAFRISPTVAGKFTWEDTNYRLRFTPDKPLEKNTLYTVTLEKSASHPDNLSMTSDFSFQFRTKSRNRLSLVAVYPFDGAKNVYYYNPYFRLVFDKKLNTTNLSTAIRVVDETNSTLTKVTRSVTNNTVIAPYGSSYFNLLNYLIVGKEYTLIIDGDVMDDEGLKVVEPIQLKFKAADVAKNFPELIQPFEQVNFEFIPDGSYGIASGSVSLTSTKLFGTYGNNITTSFSANNGSALYGILNPLNVNNDKVLGLHIFGDLTGNELSLQFSKQGNVQYLKLCDLNFYGWEFHEVELSSLSNPSEWILTGLKIERKNEYLFSAKSEILLDNMLLYDAPVLSVKNTNADNISIYPNPASTFIHIKGVYSEVSNLKLYSITGSLIKETFGDKIYTGDINQGTYILRVELNQKTYTFPVFVIH